MGPCIGRWTLHNSAMNRERSTRILQRSWKTLATLALAALSSCAGLDSEQHLAPLYTHVSTAGGGEEYEALAGAVIARREKLGTPFDQWGLRPLFLHYPDREERSHTQFLYPLGRVVSSETELDWWLMPIANYSRETTSAGTRWSLLALPGIYLSRHPDGRTANAWFPFGGHVDELFSYDELDFVLWPIFMRTKRLGRTTYHFPFPFLSYTVAPDGGGWRVWPLVGHTWSEDRYNRWFAVWPVWNYRQENLKSSAAYHRTEWTIFPLYGEVRQSTFTSRSVLWPFFGYASDPATGFWSYDGPWPLVRIQHPGDDKLSLLPDKQGSISRTRVWPFYSNYQGDGLDSTYYLWPFINDREEDYFDGHRSAFTVVPFWSQWKRTTTGGPTHSYRKAWPLFQYERLGETHSYLFPALSPFWYWRDLDEHYAWIYGIYNAKYGPEITKENVLWGVWRREHDRDEERTYLTGLWSRRAYADQGAEVTEHSLLFGLLRWRSHGNDGFSLLRPAFPGPGWPVRRVSRPEPPQGALQ
ncbi:MAG: hypothetical protein ACI9F9_002180 [Candidatus Paceibacteria bacterium]|jgi:hypothetical protein